jgi:hypothetical protein
MPFTLTHVLAVVPVAAAWPKKLPVSALVIGSMIPDFPMFFPFIPQSYYFVAHSLPGLFTACLPAGLIFFILFQAVMKRPLYALLPIYIQRRTSTLVRSTLRPNIADIALVMLAILLGAWTHIGWDDFTHADRWGAQMIPWLHSRALTLPGHAPITGAKLMQYLSSIIGLPILAVVLAYWLKLQPAIPAEDVQPQLSPMRKSMAYTIIAIIPIFVTILLGPRDNIFSYNGASRWITTCGFSFIMTALAYCIVFHIWKARKRHGQSAKKAE